MPYCNNVDDKSVNFIWSLLANAPTTYGRKIFSRIDLIEKL